MSIICKLQIIDIYSLFLDDVKYIRWYNWCEITIALSFINRLQLNINLFFCKSSVHISFKIISSLRSIGFEETKNLELK